VRVKPSCTAGEEAAVAVACGSGFEAISLVSIGIKNQIACDAYLKRASIVSEDARYGWLQTLVP
jgi:hypothetical protein